MPKSDAADRIPTLRKLRSFFSTESGPEGRLMNISLIGTAVIVALAALALFLAAFERTTESRRNDTLVSMRGIAEFEVALARVEAAQHAYLLGGQSAQLEAFHTDEAALRATTLRLIPQLRETHGHHDTVRRFEREVERWLNSAALPEIEARKRGQEVTSLVARNAGKPILDGLRASIREILADYESASEATRHTTNLARNIQTIGATLVALLAIGFIIASTLTGRKSFREYREKSDAVHAQTRAIIFTTLDGVVTVDDHGLILSMNPAAEKIFVQEEKAMVGQNISTLIPQRHLLHDMNGLSRGAMMAIGQRQGYYPFPIEISLSEMLIGTRKQFVAIIRDVTERSRSEDTLKHIGLGVSSATGEEFVRSLLMNSRKPSIRSLPSSSKWPGATMRRSPISLWPRRA